MSAEPPNRAPAELLERDVDPDPIRQFARWFDAAQRSNLPEPTAAALATASADGRPAARMVLLKSYDARGFVFYTSYQSRKARELEQNPRAALVFFWQPLAWQVRIEGAVQRVSADEADAYFATRPRGAQIGAAASFQSRVAAGRDEIDRRFAEFEARCAGRPVPRPAEWGGYRLVPDMIEFWQGRDHRLHDRLRYTRTADAAWKLERLWP